MKALVKNALRALGLEVVRYRPQPEAAPPPLPPDASPDDLAILRAVAEFTMTSAERQMALLSAARHVVRGGIEGCFVECGVWRGGSSMAVALALAQENQTGRELYLYDTFEGMSQPTEVDRTPDGTLASTHLERDVEKKGYWCVAGLDDVRANMGRTGCPATRLHYVQGKVEDTIPAQSPREPIALLRLDTDWYESTRHELTHLFPLLQPGGVLIIDDYGHWEGARRAVDEYLATLPSRYYLHRIDYTGRLLIKP